MGPISSEYRKNIEKMSEFKFALNLLKTCSGNACVSPLNIAHALGLVMLGSKDETRQEVVQALGYDDHEKAHTELSSALSAVQNTGVASAAARLFVQAGFELKEPFTTAALDKYNAPPEKVNFNDAEAACKTINDWTSKETKEMIQKLFDPSDIDPNSMVALCSALYFKGTWDKPFDEPVDGEFHLDNDNTKKCKLITVKENFAWGWDDELNVQVVELPYTSDSQMILVVPKYYDGLTELEKKLTAEKLSEMVKNLDRTQEEEVQVTMPKFELEESIDLMKTLQENGVKRIFDAAVNPLSEMTHAGLHIGAAVHKVKIVVNEKGTEAAAATGMVAMMRLAPMPILVDADHPFMFFIKSKNQVLFSGRLTSV